MTLGPYLPEQWPRQIERLAPNRVIAHEGLNRRRGLNERGGSPGRNKQDLVVEGRLDQLEDRLSGTQEAGGSNPPASTISTI